MKCSVGNRGLASVKRNMDFWFLEAYEYAMEDLELLLRNQVLNHH